MNKKHDIRLTDEERKKIQEILTSSKESKTILKRANILLMLDANAGMPMKQADIAKRCGVNVITVYNTAKDFSTKGLEYTLTFKRTKATNPAIITGEVEARIIALACSPAPEGFSKWTVRLLTERVIELEILNKVSRETVRQTLKKHNLSLI